MPFTIVRLEDTPVHYLSKEEGDRPTRRYFGKHSNYPIACHAHRTQLINRELKPHFHPVDQFQIFTGAPGGYYGRKPLSAFNIHYTDAYSPYGPIVGADEPVNYFTLRADHSNLTAYMPESRDQIDGRGGRHRLVGLDYLRTDQFPAAGASREDTVIEPEQDGLACFAVTAGPGAGIVVPSTRGTSGQFVFVAQGSVCWAGEDYGEQSIGWLDRDEAALHVEAGLTGARLFVLQFPNQASARRRQVAASAVI